MVSYSDEPSLEMVIILSYLHAIQCWSENFLLWMGGGGGGGGVMKTVKESSTNQNSCKCLREALPI